MRAAAITLGLALMPAHAAAQFGNPAFMAPDTKMEKPGVPAPNQTNNTDRLFAQLLAAGGLAEVDLGQLAADRTDHHGVKNFANRMVQDHSKANDLLKSIAEKSKIPLPGELDADHKKMRAELEKLNGKEFDLAYLSGQIVDHQRTVQLLAWQIGSGQEAELQRFAADQLPIVLDHLQMALTLRAELAGQATAQPVKAQ